MTITRTIGATDPVAQQFVTAPAKLMLDPTISFAAKGLYAYLAALPPNAPATPSWIAEQSQVHGHQAVRRAYKELQETGWLVTERRRDQRGAWTIFEWRLATSVPQQQAREAS